jgi:hypothetical protein
MSDHPTPETERVQTSSAASETNSASSRVEQFVIGVQQLRVANEADQLERRLFWAGIALPIIGVIVIWLGWWGASGTKYVYQEIPYVVSGGIFGVALVFIGAALFARYSVARLLRFWLARIVADSQLQTDRVVEAIERLAQATINGRVDSEPDDHRSRVGGD